MGGCGENFSEEKFSPDPFQKTFEQGVGGMLTRGFTVSIVGKWVCALDDWRSRPAVALRVRLRASPFAQDDTAGEAWQRKLEFTPVSRRFLGLKFTLGFQRYFLA